MEVKSCKDGFTFQSLQVLEEEKLAENATKMGEILRSEISLLNPEIVVDVRGKGLFTGITIKEMKGLLLINCSYFPLLCIIFIGIVLWKHTITGLCFCADVSLTHNDSSYIV